MLINFTPAQAGHVVPENDEGRRCTAGPLNSQINQHIDSPAAGAGEQDQPGINKRMANLRAMLALADGYSLHELADGSYVVTRWNCTRALPDLHAVAAFLRQVTGRSA